MASADQLATAGGAKPSSESPSRRGLPWTFEKTSAGPWLGSREPQRDRYWAARDRPTWRNRGPSGRGFGGGRPCATVFWVVGPTVSLHPGAVLPDGLIVPPTGAFLHDVPLAPPCCTSGQAKKLLQRVRAKHPDARLVRYRGVPAHGVRSPASISAPGAPAGWWNARLPDHARPGASSLAPHLAGEQLAAAKPA